MIIHTRTAFPVRSVIATLVATLTTIIAVAVTAATLLAAPAHAHAGLVGSTPEDGATIEQFDDTVVLTFTEEVAQPVTVVVTDPAGAGLQVGEATIDGNEVRQQVEPATVAGLHTLAFRVVSSDGHPITGQVRVTVESPDAPTPTSSSVTEDVPDASDPDTRDDDGTQTLSWLVAGGLVLGLAALLLAVLAVTTRRKKQ